MIAFRRVAILNRGEALVRFVRAQRELDALRNERTTLVALLTDPDLTSYGARIVDEIVELGPVMRTLKGAPASTYRDHDWLMDRLAAARCDAVWPGWGFVSEDAAFVARCEAAGIVFIGPSSTAMRALGDKIASKRLAAAAGLPLVPWEELTASADAAAIGARVGYPLMVKAAAGGGGRGIRRVDAPDALEGAIEAARGEALRAFGDDRLFIERAVEHGRHVEVQFVVDTTGRAVALGARDCSVQRRHQKLVEESPAPLLPDALVDTMKRGTERLAAAAHYRGVGTAEFMYQPATGALTFLEVNSRLQVEHTVTEEVWGCDLVRAQIVIARGEAWQPPLAPRGHAIQLRLNAEDPDAGFRPSPGAVPVFRPPSGPGVRVDTGIAQGDRVEAAFDSMLAKLIVWGPTRADAIARARRALDEFAVVVDGGATNKALLAAVLASDAFARAEVTTGWLETTPPARTAGRYGAFTAAVAAAVVVYRDRVAQERRKFFKQTEGGVPQTPAPPLGRLVNLRVRGRGVALHVFETAAGGFEVESRRGAYRVRVDEVGPHALSVDVDGTRSRVLFARSPGGASVEVDGSLFAVEVVAGGGVRAPAPAMVVAVDAANGDRVEAGQRLCMLEAMKMELPVVAPAAGTIRQVKCRPSMQVAAGEVLFELDTVDDAGGGDAPLDAPPPLVRPIDLLFGGDHPEPQLLDEALPEVVAPMVEEIVATVRSLMLGFDTPTRIADRVERLFGARLEFPGLRRFDHWAPLLSMLEVFVDVEQLFSRELPATLDSGTELSPQLAFYEFCRCHALAQEPSVDSVTPSLSVALAHYGVTSLEPSEALLHALWRMAVAHAHGSLRHRVCSSLLRLLVGLATQGVDVPDAHRLGAILERVAEFASEDHPSVADNAHQATYVLFKQPRYVGRGRPARPSVESVAAGDDAEAHRHMLVDTAQSVLPELLADLPGDLDGLARVVVARLHAAPLPGDDWAPVGAFDGALAARWSGGAVLAAVDADAALAAAHLLANVASTAPWRGAAHVDVLLSTAATPTQRDALSEALLAMVAGGATVAVVAGDTTADGGFTCDTRGADAETLAAYGGVHPAIARRLELDRLRAFELTRIAAPERMLAFTARARENRRDERVFVRAEVLGPAEPDVGWPRFEFERVFYEGLRIIREAQSARGRKNRFYRNRLTIYVRSVVSIDPESVSRISSGLELPTRRLGLESVNVRTRVVDPASGAIVPVEFVISKPGRHRLSVKRRAPVAEPIAPLTPYEQRVVTSRRLGLVYPYEIIAMLEGRGSEAGETAFSVKTGRFVEYDLDPASGRLEAVARPYGENTSGLIVGLIVNETDDRPDGIERVFLASDPTRALGSLAGPECERVIAALDLADERGVPLEWVAVSSGAKIAMDSGTENLDWTARVLARIVRFTQDGGELNVIVPGVNVGAQSYWNAEATMLMHTRGVLIMTRDGSMVLTGKKALEYSGSVSAEDERGIGGADRIMGPNGQAQYVVRDLGAAYATLFQHYRYTWRRRGDVGPTRRASTDPIDRSILDAPYDQPGAPFKTVGEVFSEATNPGRKRPFAIRAVMHALVDRDGGWLERWRPMRSAEMVVVWDACIGGFPVSVVGIESQPLRRVGHVPADGPDRWTGATLFPRGSKKLARAINAASGNRPLIVLANLSGFDGSPESLRRLQLEYGAEVARGVTNFVGQVIFVVVGRYHGGAYVVFSKALNPGLTSLALEGSFASVIGGAPAAAVVFPREVVARAGRRPEIVALQASLETARPDQRPRIRQRLEEVEASVVLEEQLKLAAEFDAIHTVERAVQIGSLDAVVAPARLRAEIVARLGRAPGA